MTNALLNFGDGAFRPGGRAGAVGYFVGQPPHGLAYMFHMMNEARLMTGRRSPVPITKIVGGIRL